LTCTATSGGGAPTGTNSLTTGRARVRTRSARQRVRTECYVADAGSTTARSAGRRTAAGTSRRSGITTAAVKTGSATAGGCSIGLSTRTHMSGPKRARTRARAKAVSSRRRRMGGSCSPAIVRRRGVGCKRKAAPNDEYHTPVPLPDVWADRITSGPGLRTWATTTPSWSWYWPTTRENSSRWRLACTSAGRGPCQGRQEAGGWIARVCQKGRQDSRVYRPVT
jgi:hypothetical protein